MLVLVLVVQCRHQNRPERERADRHERHGFEREGRGFLLLGHRLRDDVTQQPREARLALLACFALLVGLLANGKLDDLLEQLLAVEHLAPLAHGDAVDEVILERGAARDHDARTRRGARRRRRRGERLNADRRLHRHAHVEKGRGGDRLDAHEGVDRHADIVEEVERRGLDANSRVDRHADIVEEVERRGLDARSRVDRHADVEKR